MLLTGYVDLSSDAGSQGRSLLASLAGFIQPLVAAYVSSLGEEPARRHGAHILLNLHTYMCAAADPDGGRANLGGVCRLEIWRSSDLLHFGKDYTAASVCDGIEGKELLAALERFVGGMIMRAPPGITEAAAFDKTEGMVVSLLCCPLDPHSNMRRFRQVQRSSRGKHRFDCSPASCG